MIYKGENKTVLFKGDHHPAELYKGNKKIAGFEKASFETTDSISVSDCYNDRIHSAVLTGNSIQDGEPSPESPVEIQSVGELVTEGEHMGKYKVSISRKLDNAEGESFDIYINEPLRKIGDYADYIDFERGAVVRKIAERTIEDIGWWKQTDHTDYNTGALLYRYEGSVADKRLLIGGWSTKGELICSGLKNTLYNGGGVVDKSISERPYETGNRNLRILTSEYDTKEKVLEAYGDFKVCYILDDAYVTEEEITLPSLPTRYGYTNIFELTNTVKPTLKGEYKKIIKE